MERKPWVRSEEKRAGLPPIQVWAGEIEFIPCDVKWLYLTFVIDLCSRRVVGWALTDHMRSGLVIEAMRQAIAK